MRSLLRYCLIFAVSFACAALLFAWPDVRPHAIATIVIALRVTVGVLTACLCAMIGAWTWWRISAARSDIAIRNSAVEFAQEMSGPVQSLSTDESNLWLKAYLDLGWLGFVSGSLSVSRMKPYFVSGKAEAAWTHMTREMKRAGFAALVTAKGRGGRPYRTTRFVGPYQKYYRLLVSGAVVLSPCPQLPPPVISAERRQI